jgi:Protein of unknown function (DUF3102)
VKNKGRKSWPRIPTPHARSLRFTTEARKLRASDRANAVAWGRLLLEAEAACDHGEWLKWLDREFDRSTSTAERFMNLARMEAKFPTVGNLRVPMRLFYEDLYPDDDDLGAKITALEAATMAART